MFGLPSPQRQAQALNIDDSILHDGEVVTVERVWPAGQIADGNGNFVPGTRIDWYNPESELPDGRFSRIGMTVLPSTQILTILPKSETITAR